MSNTEDSEGFTAEERAAMKERAREVNATRRPSRTRTGDREAAVLTKIAGLPDDDRAMAERVHALVKLSAPDLTARTWYGMPAHASDGRVACFFQAASKFKTRYSTLGFSDSANLDDGSMWATSFAPSASLLRTRSASANW